MNTQDILTRVNDAMQPFAPVAKARDSRDYNAETVMRDMHERLCRLANDLEAQIRQEVAAKSGNVSTLRTITALLAESKKSPRRSTHYAWIDSEGRQCVADGYRAFRFKEHLPLEARPDDAGEPLNLDRCYPASLIGWKSFPLPSAAEIRAFIAVERAKWTGKRSAFSATWDFGPQAPSVNAKYLLDAVQVFPNAGRIFWNTIVSPMVITCEAGDALVLPLRDANKVQPQPASDDERKAIEAEREQEKQRLREAQERQAIHQAHADYAAAYNDMLKAQDRQQELRQQAKNAVEPSERNAIACELVKAFEADGKARLRQYAAEVIYQPDRALEPFEFEAIVKRLNARDRLSA